MNDDEKWMTLALEQAKKAEEHGEVPVGAVLVKDGLLVAKAHNQPISTNDPTAHAEIQLLRIAGKKLANYRLTNTSLYVTLEPCQMCAGALYWSQISRVVIGAADSHRGFRAMKGKLHPKTKFIEGIMASESKLLIQEFFKKKRNLK